MNILTIATGLNMKINKFQGQYRWLSNFYLARVVYDGDVYPSVEHAYQAAKTTDKQAREWFQDITVKPGDAKRMGKRLNLREGWDLMKIGIMLSLLRSKFYSEEKLASLLIATGDAELIEGNHWNDTFWGVCNGVGQNNLGQLLMLVRKEIST